MADTGEQDPQVQTRMALAALAAAFAKSLESRHEGMGEDILRNLEQIYVEARNWEKPATGLLETLSWTQTIYRSLK